MSTTSHEGLTAVASSMLALSTVSIALRFHSRRVQKAPLKTDDWIMIPCLLLLGGTCGTALYGTNKKILGYPTPSDKSLALETAPIASKLYFAFDLFSILTLGCVKISALCFYYRIFCEHGRRTAFRILVIISIVICSLWVAAFCILLGLSCGSHFSALWTSSKAVFLQYCGTRPHQFLLSLSISDFILDFWIIVLPIPQILTIKTTLTRRFAIIGVFLLAFVLVITHSELALKMLVLITTGFPRPRKLTQDFPIKGTELSRARLAWEDHQSNRQYIVTNTKSIYLSILEVGLSCVAVNLPSLYYLSHKVTPENVLRSVRSIISLRSIGSQNSKGYQKSKSSKDNQSVESPSLSNLRPDDVMAIETHAMYDLESTGQVSVPNDVHVTKTLSQSSQRL
ncbi:hypothetical protein BHYA_0071g00330 [Botrytis hyacinthi]|uniref:Rhodopsin domain-containing protein n=1 Tax=Botrytis hyacinthi TaxID=278943 RepID=A0A4Z1GTB5_9HELO|nr:hypothetical protein BHYA_0071g00330 [Botrytis hyacinthi]